MTIWASLKRTCFLVFPSVSVLVLSLFSPEISLAKSRIDVPAANIEIGNAVPLQLIEKIARAKSTETWGPGALGAPVPLSDSNGDVTAYMFPFCIGKDSYPAYEEIFQEVKKGRDLLDDLKNSRMERAKAAYMVLRQQQAARRETLPRDTVTSPSRVQLGQMDPIRPDGSLSRRVEAGNTREIEKLATKKSIGAGEYGTIIVSATYDRFPVPAYLHYLSPYYAQFDLALLKAGQSIGQGAALKRIYFQGLEGQYLEFANDAGTVLLNSKTLERKESFAGPNLQSMSESPISPAAQLGLAHEIADAWKIIKAEVGEP